MINRRIEYFPRLDKPKLDSPGLQQFHNQRRNMTYWFHSLMETGRHVLCNALIERTILCPCCPCLLRKFLNEVRHLVPCPSCSCVTATTHAGRRGVSDNLPTSSSELNSKRKAAQAAVDAAAQALAQEDGMDDEGFAMDEGEPPAPYMPTLPEGMETSASKPQVLIHSCTVPDACDSVPPVGSSSRTY